MSTSDRTRSALTSQAGGRRRTPGEEPFAGLDIGALRKVPVRDMAIRFAFGAAISVVAGVISIGAGPRFGGMFLAFPAILPATLSLLEKEASERQADHDDDGAVLGAASLAVFAGLGHWLFPTSGAAIALVAAAAGWLASALLLYLVARQVLRYVIQ